MSDVFVNSGEDSNITAGPAPQLQGLFIPGIDNSQFIDGFGVVTPWGGGGTARRYGDYGISSDISPQSTQLNDLASSLTPAEGGGLGYGVQGDRGPQGIRGLRGLPGIITVMGLNLPQNANFLTELPHNIDLINDLGTAANKLIYTDVLNAYTDITWTERQPAGDGNAAWYVVASGPTGSFLLALIGGAVGLYSSGDSGVNWALKHSGTNWYRVASNTDGAKLIASIYSTRLYTSTNYGVGWTERQPAGNFNKYWNALASDSDGSNLLAAESDSVFISSDSGVNWTERFPAGEGVGNWNVAASDSDGSHLIVATKGLTLHTSANSGATWVERQPAGAGDKSWNCVASDSDGSNLIAGIDGGRLYISEDYGATWTETQPAGDVGKDWGSVASDSDGSHLMAAVENGRLYSSSDSGTTWVEEQPAGDTNLDWETVALDSDGSNSIAAVFQGRLYTGVETTLYSETTWAESDLSSAGRAILDDATAADQATTLGLGTGDSPTFAGVIIADGGTVGQAAGGLITFDDSANTLLFTAAAGVGINLVTASVGLHIAAPVGSSQICIYSNSDYGAGTGTHIQWQTGATTGNTYVGYQVWNGGGTSQNALHVQPFGGFTRFGGSYSAAPVTQVTIAGTLTLLEQAAADGDTATYGQLWVKNTTPNELWFTDDAGTDVQLGIAASLVTSHESTYNHTNYNTAYTHSQLASGNPHSVTPTELSLVIGTNTQAWDAGLDALAALTCVSDSFIKVTATDTYAIRTIAETKSDLSLNLVENTAHSSDAHTMTLDGRDVSVDGTKLDGIEALADVTATAETSHADVVVDGDFGSNGLMERTGAGTYGIKTIGTDVQAYDAGLTNLAGVAMVADKFYYTSADNTHVAGTVTAAGRALLDDATAAAQATTLGLGTGDSPTFTELTLTADINLAYTTNSNTGIIYKGNESFIHNFEPSGSEGDNTFVGQNAGNFTMAISGQAIHASHNTAIGKDALMDLTTGFGHVAIGDLSGANLTIGYRNVFIGYYSGWQATTSSGNIGIGYSSMVWNAIGVNNTVIGYEAGAGSGGAGVSDYSNCTLCGYQAGNALRDAGVNNLFLGYQAGFTTTTGTGNIIIGYDIDATAVDASNELNIGGTLFGLLDTNKIGINDVAPNSTLDVTGDINTTVNYKVDDVQVISNQGAAVADATGAGDVVAQLNALLARCRAHGLIAT